MNSVAPKRAMVIVAHPDDPEFFCGGLIALWAKSGTEITYLILTDGRKGTDDLTIPPAHLIAMRQQEQQAAADYLGVQQVIYFDEPDGELKPSLAIEKQVVAEIRRHQPEAVISFDPTRYYLGDFYLNHPDHRAAGEITINAIFPAVGSPLYYPPLVLEGLNPHTLHELYLWGAEIPNLWVDVTEVDEIKTAALHYHASQINGLVMLGQQLRQYQKTVNSAGQEILREGYQRIRFS
ncbi:PIG-L deacetylase family protein [Anaerolineales bacterium HSG25]|nr:PIG-L deacetylase family protein [Anaerolineales bacterium HSG25]